MIYIIGAGAIGRALAVFLRNCGTEITLISARPNMEPGPSQRQYLELPNGDRLTADLQVITLNEIKSIQGPVLIASKSYGNLPLAKTLAKKGTNYPVVILQNGLNIEQAFIKEGFKEIFRCVLMVTSQFSDSHTLIFKPVSDCPIGSINGTTKKLPLLVKMLKNPWFGFVATDKIQPLVWKKVIVNCVFNSVCPLLNTDNGIFHRDTDSVVIASRIVRECIAVANLHHIVLDYDDVMATLLSISKSSNGQLISTLQDILAKRPTEIGTLNLEIVRLADLAGAGNMVRETRLLGELIALKSAINLTGSEIH